VTRRSYQMQKHKFGVMFPDALFTDTAPGAPEREKYCVDISCPGHTKMYYVTVDPTGCNITSSV
jgi:hypothetical protein